MGSNTLKIGCVVNVTLSSSNRLIGEFNGFKEKPHAIVLKNVRFWQEVSQTSSESHAKCDTIFGELLVESQHILKLDILEEDIPNTSSDLIHYEDNDVVTKSVVPLVRTNQCEKSPFSWLPGSKPFRFLYRADIQKEMQKSMQDYCKKLFDNTNFVQLIPSSGMQSKNIGGTILPKYFASFYREPIITSQVESNAIPQHNELVSYHQEFSENHSDLKMHAEDDIQNNEIFDQNACAMIISELLSNPEDNEDPIISVHQLDCDLGKLNLHDPMDTEIAKPKLSVLPHYEMSPFLRYSNGHLYLNETFFGTLCQPTEHNETKGNESLCVEDPNNFAMDFQSIED